MSRNVPQNVPYLKNNILKGSRFINTNAILSSTVHTILV